MTDVCSRLAIDIGGTNIRLGLLEQDSLVPQQIGSYRIDDFTGLADVIGLYFEQVSASGVQDVSVAVATPVVGDRVKLTNHDWNFSIRETYQHFGFRRLKVVNDFTALALSIPWLRPDELELVGGGEPDEKGAIALLGPGTGLGVSGLVQAGDGYFPLSGEGGHVSLGARNARELAVFNAFLAKYGHMSAERLLSGTGLTEFYQILRQLDGLDTEALRAEEISARALDASCTTCVEVMALFCEWLGIVASNLVLTLGATGGLYIGGGIVPKLGDYFTRSGFREQFERKGRFSTLMQQVPAYVINAEQPALRGAAYALEPRFDGLGVICA